MFHDHRLFDAAVDAAGFPLMPLGEVLGAFSYALDLTEGQPPGHSLRATWVALHVARAAGCTEAEQRDAFYATLLKDLGCSANASRVAEIYGADDRAFKHDWKRIGVGLMPTLRFVASATARGRSLPARAAAVARILRDGDALAQEMIETRCSRGAAIARTLRFDEAVAGAIHSLDEHWDGGGRPAGLRGDAIPLASRLALLGQVVDVFHAAGGPEAALAQARARAGAWLDPALVDALDAVGRDPAFWSRLASPVLEGMVMAQAPARATVLVDEDYLDDIAAAFGQVVDAKSPYTAAHSVRVGTYAERMGASLGLDGARLRWLRRGALLHDIGKLGVSSAILDKPGRLDADEWEGMRAHAAHTREVLARIAPLEELAPIAAAHHERLDGRGYPLQLSADAIRLETRIITACDIWDALTADRPYRPALAPEDALAVMERGVGAQIDGDCFEALRAAARELG